MIFSCFSISPTEPECRTHPILECRNLSPLCIGVDSEETGGALCDGAKTGNNEQHSKTATANPAPLGRRTPRIAGLAPNP